MKSTETYMNFLDTGFAAVCCHCGCRSTGAFALGSCSFPGPGQDLLLCLFQSAPLPGSLRNADEANKGLEAL